MKQSHIAVIGCLTILLTLWIGHGLSRVFAQSPSPSVTVKITPSESSPTPTSGKAQQIEDLKDRLATKVAQLRQSQKKAVYGTVKSVAVANFVVETTEKDVKIELPDELLVAQRVGGKRTKLASEDIAKDDVVTVFGDYDTTLDVLTPQAVYIQSALPFFIHGVIRSLDQEDFTIILTSPANDEYTIDVERNTKTNAWSSAGGIEKSGFSKLEEGNTVLIWGVRSTKNDRQVKATRILSLGDGISGAVPEPTQTPTPTEKITPTAKPTTTPKSTATPADE